MNLGSILLPLLCFPITQILIERFRFPLLICNLDDVIEALGEHKVLTLLVSVGLADRNVGLR